MPRRSWKDIATRLRGMEGAEISSRLQQAFYKRADLFYSRLGFPFDQDPSLSSATAHFFFEPSEIPEVLDVLRVRFPRQVEEIIQDAEGICDHRFRLLGYSDLDYGPRIDWHLDAVNHICSPYKPFFRINYLDPAQVGDPKVTWELSRHQHLVILAKAYRLTNNPKFALECFSQWYSWQARNVYPLGIHWSSSLEVGFRSLSWFWLSFLLGGCEVMPQAFPRDLLRAFSVNGRYIERFLSTYTSPNTHLLGEAVALFFLGTLCPQLASARSWQQMGWRIVLEEARNQVRADGLHFEQSTYYHVYALDFFLHARILAARNNVGIPDWFDQTLLRMLDGLRLLSQAGPPPSFGDDDGGRVFDSNRNRREHLCDPLATGAALFQRGDFKFAAGGLREETCWLLGPDAAQRFDDISPANRATGSNALTDSGIYVMVGSGEPRSQLVIDAGPQGTHNAGHGHADALSVHLSADAEELLCDPGTFEYGGNGVGRNWFRSTGAHNTLSVDGLDQAEAKGAFGWTSLTKTSVERWHTGRNFDIFRASHTGYTRLKHPVTHERWVVNFKAFGWLIRDVAVGAGSHALDLAWHLGPKLSAVDNDIFADELGNGLRFLPCPGAGWSLETLDEWWSPAYGVKIPAKTIHLRFNGPIPAESGVFLQPVDAHQSQITASLRFDSQEQTAVRAYSLIQGQDRCVALFSPAGPRWSFLGWSSDADLLCCCFTGDRLTALTLCNATFVDWHRQRLWSRPQPAPWCELERPESNKDVTMEIVSTGSM